MLEFKENETIEVIDTQAWIETNDKRVEIQLIVTNIRFFAVQETKNAGKKVVCSLNLDEIEHIDHQPNNTVCWLTGNRYVKFDSNPIANYLLKLIANR